MKLMMSKWSRCPNGITFLDGCVISGYIIEVLSLSVKSNFELYTANVTAVLRARKYTHKTHML